jgi:hypothetical protein
MSGIINDNYKEELTRLEMLRIDGEPTGLYFVTDKEFAEPRIRIALEQAEYYEADAVFFRTFPDGDTRSPLPQIYIYYNTALSLDETRYAGIHRRLWNAGIVPLVFILTTSQVKILNCRQEPKFDQVRQEPIYTPFLALEEILVTERAFVTREISSGTFWEDPKFKNDFALEKTAYYKLLIHLKAFRQKLLKLEILSESTANRILVMSILVKYLNDRQDSAGNRVFGKRFLSKFSHANTDDLELLFREKGSCIRLFDHLSEHFNGGIFELSKDEKVELEQADLSSIADFLKGDQDPSGQLLFWPLYSFQDLPVELISNIYEEFLATTDKNTSKGVVYTPPMLVAFLLDQCLPLKAETLSWKILDPACGSGVFLVGAFKRLIQCWRMANDWEQPSHLDLQGILKNCIFGFDKESEAVLITAFSLCVALCDELEPLVIWNKLRFDNLQKCNLQARDFFEIVESGEFDNSFDLVVGNPPFIPELTTAAAKRVAAKMDAANHKLPGKQLALLFLEQAHLVCKKEGIICLIQPAGPLLYNVNSTEFRKKLFNTHKIHYVFDFTPLERVLFNAQVASVAILMSKGSSPSDRLLHVTFRRTKSVKEKLLFELDPYDLHWISNENYSHNPYVWKSNLLGGGRLHRLVKRFSGFPTLKKYLDEKQEKHGWVISEGFKRGNPEKISRLHFLLEAGELSENETLELNKLRSNYKKAPYLTGKPFLPTSGLVANGIDNTQIIPLDQVYFDRRRVPDIYHPPHVLIREKVDQSRIPVVLCDNYLTFEREIIAIHAPEEDRSELKYLAETLGSSSLPVFLASIFSGRYLVSRATALLKHDLLSMPFISPNTPVLDFELSLWEEAIIQDVLEYLIQFCTKGEESQVLKTVTSAELTKFGDMYCNALNPVYKLFHPLTPIRMGAFICYPFCYGNIPQIELPDENKIVPFLEELLHHQHGSRLFVNRILRIYEQNVIFMVKPNQKRYWLRSIALRDADETLVDLLEQGY